MVLTFIILLITIVLFIIGRWPADLVALCSVLALFLAGILDLEQALSGFSSSTVIMIASLFIVGEGLSRTGVTAWLGQKMLSVAGSSKLRLLVVIMAGTALLSAFISNTGTVATLMPAVTSASWSVGSIPSKFLMPMAFAANSGGLLTLTGTPPNIIVNDVLAASGEEPFGYFEYALIGLPLLLAAIVYMVSIGRRLLPSRRTEERPPELFESMGELAEDYVLPGNIYQLRVRNGSELIGQTLEQAGLGRDYGVSVLSLNRHDARIGDVSGLGRSRQLVREGIERLQTDLQDEVPGPDTVVRVDDILLVKGASEAIQAVMIRFNVAVQPADTGQDQLTTDLISHEIGLAEVVIAPRSAYRRRTVAQGHFAEKYRVQVLSLRRVDQTLDLKNARLSVGDALLVRGTWEDIELLKNERRNFVVVGSPEEMVRQVVELSPQAAIAVLALVGMIILMVSGLVPVVIAALLAAVVMVLGRCLSMPQAYRTISWNSVVLIAAMIPMSIALQETGGAEFVANGMINTLGSIGPVALMAGIFLATTALSQVVSNSATTVLMAPIVLQVGLDMGLA
ncbi:MAG TPA: SLC13 family permease, partial [candidate division Zixibacteria bacterium]|nr:SLC13 family permease [candidate division Zixibacteria bacterium]